jgi:hypothetical protein
MNVDQTTTRKPAVVGKRAVQQQRKAGKLLHTPWRRAGAVKAIGALEVLAAVGPDLAAFVAWARGF